MNLTNGLTKHRIFLSIENKAHLLSKPITSHIKSRAFPDIQQKNEQENYKNRLSETLKSFINFEEDEKKHLFNTKKTSIKLKLLRAKKRTISKCSLGIGFENPLENQRSNIILSQHFFPQRSLTLFKKIAFKNSSTKLQNGKTSYLRNNENEKQERRKIKLRVQKNLENLERQQASMEIRHSCEQIHLKINTVGRVPLNKENLKKCITMKSITRTNGQFIVSERRKPSSNLSQFLKAIELEDLQDCQELSPWNFEKPDNHRQAIQLFVVE